MAGVTLLGLKRRLKTVTATRKITMAMEMVATSKYQKARLLLQNNTSHFAAFQDIVAEISYALSSEDAPTGLFFCSPNPQGGIMYVVFNSLKGLCAGYNSAVGRKAEEMARLEPEFAYFIATGMRSLVELKKLVSPEYLVVEPLGDLPGYGELDPIFQHCLGLYREGRVREVRVIYTRFMSALRTEVVVETLFPLPVPEKNLEREAVPYEFEPSAEEMQEPVFMMYLREKLYHLMLEAKSAEHSTRMRAMNSANKNAEALIVDLKKQLNRVRQTAITQEITEIVGGAEALK